MEIILKEDLSNDILSFCKANSIDDVENFALACLLKGYNIVKYGLSPMDNVNKENKPLSIDVDEKVNNIEHKGKKVKILKK